MSGVRAALGQTLQRSPNSCDGLSHLSASSRVDQAGMSLACRCMVEATGAAASRGRSTTKVLEPETLPPSTLSFTT